MRGRGRMGIWVASGLLAAAAPVAVAQMGPGPLDPLGMPGASQGPGRPGRGQQPMPQPQQQPPLIPDPNQTQSRIEHDQAKLRNMDRQKQIVADTQKLVALANELNAAVEKSDKDTLSLDVIRKADQIEKLAKAVREKMKGS